AAACRFFLDRFARRALGADEQDRAALLRDRRDEVHRVAEQRQRLLEVDDVDLAARAEDVRRHARIPVTGLVAEMHASFEHLAHRDLRHGGTPKRGGREPWFRAAKPGVETSTSPALATSWRAA